MDLSKFDPEAVKLFLEEATDMQDQIEESLLTLEADPTNQDAVNNAFRGFHTIKGGAGMIGFEELQKYTHEVEFLLSDVRGGSRNVTEELITALLSSIDCLRGYCSELEGEDQFDHGIAAASLAQIRILSGAQDDSVDPPEQETTPQDIVPTQQVLTPPTENQFRYLIRLKFSEDILENGGDPIALLKDFYDLGECYVTPHCHSIPNLEILDPVKLHLHWSLVLSTTKQMEELEDVLMFFMDEEGIEIKLIQGPPDETKIKRDINAGILEATTEQPRNQPEPKPSSPPVTNKEELKPSNTTSNSKQEKKAPKTNIPKKRDESGGSIHVSNMKLDKLMNLVGETVINQARLKEFGQELRLADRRMGDLYQQIVYDSDIVVRELQDQVMNIRMVPIKGTFLPLQRIVRDYCVSSGKKIKLQISGGETELDKNVSEKLGGPLKHLVRNAMDHGIESIEKRLETGKEEEGTIYLRAFHGEGHVFIEVQDDGGGINSEVILKKALNKGLIDEKADLDEQEIFRLLFHAGFSTAENVSDISGRGVGMDVVRQEIESLRGSIFINSEVGKGSTFQIKLPLTLAIIEGMLVQVHNQIFTIPLLSVLESIRPTADQFRTMQKQGEVIEIRGEYLPVLNLGKAFNLESERKKTNEEKLVVIVENNKMRCGLLVDRILDQQQVVIKSMEENFFQIPGIAGATILGDGGVSLILDLPSLLRKSFKTN
jgi:two-component system chemotaxis sensor kinase CheA